MGAQADQRAAALVNNPAIERTQVADDAELLELMLSDLKSSDPRFQPTHFWRYYERRFLPELRDLGLRDFRRRHNSALSAFGGTDPYQEPFSRRNVLGRWPLLRGLPGRSPLIDRVLYRLSSTVPNPHFRDIVAEYRYWRVKDKFAQVGMDLRKCSTSYVGNPEGTVELEGRPWTATHLEYCSLLADAARHVPFRPDMFYCELGTGMGRSVEIIASLFENATVLMFDIPPQLYVANQYLTKVFGSRVVGYREANALTPGSPECASAIRGRIVIQPAWRMPIWAASTKIEVFWNSASFQEMEPDVVSNYLALVKKMRPEHVYINAMPGGNYHPGKAEKGELGTKAPVLAKQYSDALSDQYDLSASYDSDHLDGGEYGHHVSYVFKRKGAR